MICDKFTDCLLNNHSDTSERCKTCREIRCDQNISCSENGKHYNLLNDKGFIVVNFLIDGGVFVNEIASNKCDRMYHVDDPKQSTFILIELKGKNVKHALEQLYDTATRYKAILQKNRCFFRIVCSRAPNIANDRACIELKKKLKSQFDNIPLIREKKIEDVYSKL